MGGYSPYDHHRGPYQFVVMRETPKRKVKYHNELLQGTVEVDDIVDEARALLSDKRDTITSIYVFSVTEQQHVMTYTRDSLGVSSES